MQRKIILLSVLSILIIAITAISIFSKSNQVIPSPPATTTSIIPPVQPSSSNGLKTYANSEYAFEFEYPDGWTAQENSFKNYYSKFNLEIVPPGKIDLFDPILINIALPEFADRTFLSVGATTSSAIIAGVLGIKYEYEFEGTPEIDIVLPFGKYKMILGTKKNMSLFSTKSSPPLNS